jgi:hypothetical protein
MGFIQFNIQVTPQKQRKSILALNLSTLNPKPILRGLKPALTQTLLLTLHSLLLIISFPFYEYAWFKNSSAQKAARDSLPTSLK